VRVSNYSKSENLDEDITFVTKRPNRRARFLSAVNVLFSNILTRTISIIIITLFSSVICKTRHQTACPASRSTSRFFPLQGHEWSCLISVFVCSLSSLSSPPHNIQLTRASERISKLFLIFLEKRQINLLTVLCVRSDGQNQHFFPPDHISARRDQKA